MEQWVQRNLAHQEANGYGLFSFILKSNGLLIGDCGLERMEIQGTQTVELGFDFRSDHWNRGYATEAATAVRDFAFDQLRLPRLISLIRVGNIASKRVAEKVGMSLNSPSCTMKPFCSSAVLSALMSPIVTIGFVSVTWVVIVSVAGGPGRG